MTFDDKHNIVEVCLFESHLAKYFIEHPEFFQPLIKKILDAIEQVININSDKSAFSRLLFSVFSTISEEYPHVTDMSTLKNSNSLIIFDTFCKYFTERAMSISSIKLPEMESKSAMQVPSLSALAQHSLFKSSEFGQKLLLDKLRPASLYLDKNRGVIETDSSDSETETHDLGILSSLDTPDSLKSFFKLPHYPSRQYYKPKEDSSMTQWLREHSLPAISGASGGIGKTISKINSFVVLSPIEYQLLGILIASSTIALGHHSFFEVMRPLSFFTGELKSKCNLLAFYEQAIPEEVKCSASYKEHIETYAGLIDEFIFNAPKSEYSLSQ